MKDTRCQRAINQGILEDAQEMGTGSGPSRRYEGYVADLPNSRQLPTVVTTAYTILVHAIQDNLASSPVL